MVALLDTIATGFFPVAADDLLSLWKMTALETLLLASFFGCVNEFPGFDCASVLATEVDTLAGEVLAVAPLVVTAVVAAVVEDTTLVVRDVPEEMEEVLAGAAELVTEVALSEERGKVDRLWERW